MFESQFLRKIAAEKDKVLLIQYTLGNTSIRKKCRVSETVRVNPVSVTLNLWELFLQKSAKYFDRVPGGGSNQLRKVTQHFLLFNLRDPLGGTLKQSKMEIV